MGEESLNMEFSLFVNPAKMSTELRAGPVSGHRCSRPSLEGDFGDAVNRDSPGHVKKLHARHGGWETLPLSLIYAWSWEYPGIPRRKLHEALPVVQYPDLLYPPIVLPHPVPF